MNFTIENVKIYTMEADTGIIQNGYVKVTDGKISEVGTCSGGNGSGGWLFPGFIDGHTHLGLCEDSIGFEGDDINESVDPISPQLRSIDGINPFDRCFEEARNSGVTCVAVAPGSANPIGGQICVIKTSGKRIDNMAVCTPAAVKFALGENPKESYHSKNQSPETRMATAALIREYLFKAVKYAEALEKAHAVPESEDEDVPDEPDFDIKLEALLPVIKGDCAAHFHAHRADDIFTAIRISKEFNLKYTLIHCTEGHLIADELSDEKSCAFVGPNLCDRSKPELRSLTFENPKILCDAGVKIGLTTDHPVIPLNYLPLCAALAVKNGMDAYEAFKSITINPAEILGVADRVGSIKVGKDADLVLYDGNPLDVMSKILQVWINGNTVKA